MARSRPDEAKEQNMTTNQRAAQILKQAEVASMEATDAGMPSPTDLAWAEEIRDLELAESVDVLVVEGPRHRKVGGTDQRRPRPAHRAA
jgi:hypothetical protein